MFNHANAKLPGGVDRWLRRLIVTPDMHRVHHSTLRAETSSNFGFNLPWWDHLFGTYRAQPARGHAGVTIGVDAFRSAAELRLDRLLAQPFRDTPGSYPLGRGPGASRPLRHPARKDRVHAAHPVGKGGGAGLQDVG